jgi:hypothetical protein
MKKHILIWLFISLLGLIILGGHGQIASADFNRQDRRTSLQALDQQAAPTLIPTSQPVAIENPTPENRVLPPVGSNAGLVAGAIVLVLIIIGGVLSSRLRAKH